MPTWNGDYWFLLRNLIMKDFKVRYRNMSLGVLWSLVNPAVMLVVYLFVFTKIFHIDAIPHFSLYLLSGMIVFNFFNMAWVTGTCSLVDNATLIKRVPVPREMVTFATILANCLHVGIQLCLLLLAVVLTGLGINVYWLWLPVIWALGIIFVVGISLVTAGLHVYLRDTRYIVESICLIMFWFVPVFYAVSFVPEVYRNLYVSNPVAAQIVTMRNVLLDGQPPSANVLLKLTFCALGSLMFGMLVFRKMKAGFYDHL